VDYCAMDIKSSLERYSHAAGVDVDIEAIQRSIDLLKTGRVPYEFRVTACRAVCGPDDLRSIRDLVKDAALCRLQEFVPGPGVLDPSICREERYTEKELVEWRREF
jgi:pyruvate formate lyase activating enzyme